jgi:methanogenic corrinoid protein MtbC1
MDGWGVAQIADEAIAPAMWRLGDLWRHRPEGIFIEHRATDLCIEAIERLRWSLPEPPPEAPVAVGAAAANDPYLMPTLLAVTVLRETGFRAVNLGPETPAETLMQAVRDQRPRLAWLSVSTTVAADALAGKLTRLAAECGELGARLIVGGRVHGLLRKDAGEAVTFGANMGELAAFARGLLAGA